MMGLTVRQHGSLPAKTDDLANFIAVEQEKLTAVRAAIREIQQLNMAKEVYDQKNVSFHQVIHLRALR